MPAPLLPAPWFLAPSLPTGKVIRDLGGGGRSLACSALHFLGPEKEPCAWSPRTLLTLLDV